MYQFLDKTDNFEFLGPNLIKNRLWGQNFRNPSLDSESASLTYYEYQFSNKTDNFEFLGPNLGKLLKYVQYFGLNILEGVEESWVEAEISWLKVEMRWVEVDGVGWSWVEVGIQKPCRKI